MRLISLDFNSFNESPPDSTRKEHKYPELIQKDQGATGTMQQ
jgi:hypothetical protein